MGFEQGAPFPYSFINASAAAVHPSFLKIHNTGLANQCKRYIFMDIISTFKLTIPDWWDETFTKVVLFGNGHFTIFETDKFGVIPMNNTLSGMNVFYMPNKSLVSNPLIESRELTIGKDCVLVNLTNDYRGICDIVNLYGDLMALTIEGAAVNILNSRLAYLAVAENKAHAEGLKKIIDKILSGEPVAIERKREALSATNSESPFNLFLQNVGQNFIAPEMIEALQNIQAMYRAEIGVPSLNVRKKERLIVDEVNKDDDYTQLKARAWIDNVKRGFARAEKMFPVLRGKLDFDFAYDDGGGGDDAGDAVNSGAI